MSSWKGGKLMARKSTLAIVVLLGILFAVGYAQAAERGSSTRTPSIRSVTATATQVQSTSSLSLSKILRARFLHTWKMLADLEDAQPEPPVFGTNGLSDGPDPIDGGGNASGPTPPPEDKQGGADDGDDGDNLTGIDSN